MKNRSPLEIIIRTDGTAWVEQMYCSPRQEFLCVPEEAIADLFPECEDE